MISIICVYNNKEQYENQLVNSLKTQACEFELVGIDNTNAKFTSAAKSLNYGAKISKGEYLIFVHQDLTFKSPDEIKAFSEYGISLPIGSILGAVGVKEKSYNYYGNWTSGALYDSTRKSNITAPVEVDSIDESVIGMSKKTWERHHFDEILCDSWHMYAVETCLWNRKNKGSIYVYPMQVHHYSHGHIDLSYMKTFVKLADYYRKDFNYIWTTCYKWTSSWLFVRLLYIVWVINRRVRGNFE